MEQYYGDKNRIPGADGFYWALKNTNGSWGVAYFGDDDTPVSRETIQQAGGDVGMVESQLAGDMLDSISGYAPWQGPASVSTPEIPVADRPQPVTTQTPTSTTGGGTATKPNYAWGPDGQMYNLDDPNQAQTYTQVKNNYLEGQYQQQLQDFQRDSSRTAQDITDSRANLESQRLNYFGNGQDVLGQVGQNIKDLGDTKEKRNIGFMRSFASKSPGVYQSAEGSNIGESNNLYDTGVKDVNRQANETENYFNQYGQGLDRNQEDLNTSLERQPLALSDWLNQQKGANLTDLMNVSKANSWKYTSPTQLQSRSVDVSGVMSQLQNSPYKATQSANNNYFNSNPAVAGIQKLYEGVQNGTTELTPEQKQLLGIV
jgi:hypothetical protein